MPRMHGVRKKAGADDYAPTEDELLGQTERLKELDREFRSAHGSFRSIKKALDEANSVRAAEERASLARKAGAVTAGQGTSWKRVIAIVVVVLALNWRNFVHMKQFFDDPTPAAAPEDVDPDGPWHGARGGPRSSGPNFGPGGPGGGGFPGAGFPPGGGGSGAGYNPNPGDGANPDQQGPGPEEAPRAGRRPGGARRDRK